MSLSCESFVVRVYLGSKAWFYYALVFTEDRIVAAKLRQCPTFDAAAIGAIYLGVLGALFGRSSKKRYREKLKEVSEKLKDSTPEEILKMDEENFQIFFADVRKVSIKEESSDFGIGKLTVEGNVAPLFRKLGSSSKNENQKEVSFHIEFGQSLEQCRTIISRALPNKLTLDI